MTLKVQCPTSIYSKICSFKSMYFSKKYWFKVTSQKSTVSWDTVDTVLTPALQRRVCLEIQRFFSFTKLLNVKLGQNFTDVF